MFGHVSILFLVKFDKFTKAVRLKDSQKNKNEATKEKRFDGIIFRLNFLQLVLNLKREGFHHRLHTLNV